MTIEQVIAKLRRPFPPEAVSFKIQSAKGKKALIVGFIDARQVGERLNLVVPDRWGNDFKSVESGGNTGVQCTIQIRAEDIVIARSDVGIMEGGFGGLKAVYSDAFKRAAVHFGIGVPLYYSPRFYADKDDLDKSGENYYLSRKVEQAARDNYRTWLKNEGVARFGQPLDLGDKLEDQGDIEVDAPAVSEEIVGVNALTGEYVTEQDNGTITEEEAAKLRQYFRTVSSSLSEDKANALAAQIQIWLSSKGVSSLDELGYEDAERFHDYLSHEAEQYATDDS